MDAATRHHRIRTALLCAALLAAAGARAGAVGTAANTAVSNTATFSYSYTGVSGATNASTTANVSFVVDRKIDLTLTDANSGYNSAQTATPGPGTNPAVLRFTLTNTGNATLDFSVAAVDGSDPHGGTDSYDQTASVFVDVNGDGTYAAATDTATFVDELASGSSIAVFVVGAIPSGAIDGDISGKLLTATARAGGGASVLGAALTQTAGAETPASMDTVFADAAGAGDASRDGALGARDAFRVISTVLGISKAVSALSDPENGGTNPKAIPGATLRYTITVNNPAAAGAAAQSVTVTDALPAGVTYVSPSITVDGGATGTDANDGVDASGYDVRQSGGTVTVVLGNMPANTTRIIRFSVTVDANQAAAASISNTASAAYSIASVAQTPITSSAAFLVDRAVNLTLTDANAGYNSDDTPTPYPGLDDAVLQLTLTNTGNGTQDFSLALADGVDPHGGTDTYDQNASVFVDVNGDGNYAAATDTATFVDELAAGASIAVFVVGDVQLNRDDADISGKLVTATARAGGAAAAQGAVLTQTAGAETATLVDVVFRDAAGAGDASRDGALGARDAYKLFAPDLSVTKASFVVSDPVNGTGAGRKRIPGATVRYQVVVTNTAGAGSSAHTVVMSDLIPANTSYVAGTLTLNGVADPDADDGGNDCDFGVTAAGTVTCALGTIAPAQSRTITFDVTVD